jgi:hypothetical protein
VSGEPSTTPFLHKQEHHVTVGSIRFDPISPGSGVGTVAMGMGGWITQFRIC